MPSLRAIANRMQTALAMRGRLISINQYQSFSEKAGRMVTKFVCSEKNEKGKYRTVFESWQLAEIVKFLAGELNGGGDG